MFKVGCPPLDLEAAEDFSARISAIGSVKNAGWGPAHFLPISYAFRRYRWRRGGVPRVVACPQMEEGWRPGGMAGDGIDEASLYGFSTDQLFDFTCGGIGH